jgi:hypothetical protein
LYAELGESMSGSQPARRLWALAWANAVLHGLGLAAAWFGMRPGSAVEPLAERTAYLASRPVLWSWGWGIWMLCALLLVAFIAALGRCLPAASIAARLALALTAAGMAVDLLCDGLQIAVLPGIAAAGPPSQALFLAFERLAFTGGATVANGLYTSGVVLMTLRLGARLRRPARLAGYGTGAAGYAMAAAGLLPSPALLALATGPAIVSFSLWTVLVARDLHSPEAEAAA